MPVCSQAHVLTAFLRGKLAFDGWSKSSALGGRWKTRAKWREIGPRSAGCFTSKLQAARRCTARSNPWQDTKALQDFATRGQLILITGDCLWEVVFRLRPSRFD